MVETWIKSANVSLYYFWFGNGSPRLKAKEVLKPDFKCPISRSQEH